jgi:hypothetical protein
MFDPTVFDLDNLEQRIVISGRKDTMELSVMERVFS